ncbi:MAG: T9SS type A sorting domain-containing protein [Bacteroidetes bacterium]|nr:T9SS type A sorting domain-containing protein [Bacteroidota bacterium]
MKLFVFLIASLLFTNSYSSEIWVPAGTMSSGNTDWVYAMNSNSAGEIFASSWAVGIYKGSAGSTTSWNFSGLSGKRISDLFVAPNGNIFGYSHTTSTAYIHRSTDNGATWQDVYTRAFPNNYAGGGGMVFPLDGSIVAAFAVTVGPTIGDVATYVFKSTDGGSTWVQKSIIQAGFVGGMKLLKDGRIFMGTSLSGVVKSTNNGENWSSMNTFSPIYIHNILQDKDEDIYVCDAYGPNRSTNNGQTFFAVNTPAPGGLMIETSFVDSRGDFYISYDHNNIYRSTNKGSTWELLNTGLTGTTYICSFTEANGKIYAGTNNKGAFYLSTDVVGISNGYETVKEFSLRQNYPNPFNPVTNISYNVPKSSLVNLSVYDMLGKKVAELVNENISAGNYEIIFDASKLSTGVYYYKLQTESFSETKKMILSK